MTRAHDRQKTLPQRRCTSCVYQNDPQRPICRHIAFAFAFAASRHASRARSCSASLQPWYEPTTRPSTGSQARSAASTGRADEVTLHLLTHAWVARAVRLPAVLVVQRARLRDVLAVHPPRPLRHRRPRLGAFVVEETCIRSFTSGLQRKLLFQARAPCWVRPPSGAFRSV